MKTARALAYLGMAALAVTTPYKAGSGSLEEVVLERQLDNERIEVDYDQRLREEQERTYKIMTEALKSIEPGYAQRLEMQREMGEKLVASLRNSDETFWDYINRLKIKNKSTQNGLKEVVSKEEVLGKYGEMEKVFNEHDVPQEFRDDIYDIVTSAEYARPALDIYKDRLEETGVVKFIRDKENSEKIIGAYGEASIYSKHQGWDKTSTGGPVWDDKLAAAINDGLLMEIADKTTTATLPALFLVETECGKKAYCVGDNSGPYDQNKGYGDGEVKWITEGKRKYPTPHPRRVIDMSPALAKQLGLYEGEKNGSPLGLGRVQVQYITSLSDYIPKK